MLYLSANSDLLDAEFYRQFSGAYQIVFNVKDHEKFAKCNIEQRRNACINATHNFGESSKISFNQYSISSALKASKFVGSVILMPFVAFVGFSLNLLTILIIKSKKNEKEFYDKKSSQSRLFNFIVLNSMFNMIECFLNIFGLMNICLGLNSIYCSSIDDTMFAIYFKIILIEYVGEIMKTCSHLTALAFSIERYIETVKCERKVLKLFKKMKLRTFLIFTLIVSSLLCVNKLFEYVQAQGSDINKTTYEYPFFSLMHRSFQAGESWYKWLFMLHYTINDLILFSIQMIVDILLVIQIKKDLRTKKATLRSTMGRKKEENVIKKLNYLSHISNETNRMIIYSLTLNIFYRLPEFVLYYYIIMIFKLNQLSIDVIVSFDFFCLTQFCGLMINLIEFVYLLSYSFFIFFYFKYNISFRNGFKKFFSKQTNKKF